MKKRPRRRSSNDDLHQNDRRRDTRDRLVELLEAHPETRIKEAAEILGISMTRVKQLAIEERFRQLWVRSPK